MLADTTFDDIISSTPHNKSAGLKLGRSWPSTQSASGSGMLGRLNGRRDMEETSL
jgi:hypothetical protein